MREGISGNICQLAAQALMLPRNLVLTIPVSCYCVIDGVSFNGTLNIYAIKEKRNFPVHSSHSCNVTCSGNERLAYLRL
jgi:hypothetical protein